MNGPPSGATPLIRHSNIAESVGWAFFLAASWTWCIGMFLPALLIRDYGFTGWAVFAIPNVIGAAAMAWVLRSPRQSVAVVTQHRAACVLFSAVTIAFHVFFLMAIVSWVTGAPFIPLIAAVILALLFLPLLGIDAGATLLSAALIAISTVLMFLLLAALHHTPEQRPILMVHGVAPDLAALAPVCVIGFFCCPYLDLTFHRVRQRSAAPRLSFGLGFCVLFLAMILFTVVYSHAVLKPASRWIGWLIGAHLIVQSAFTISAHLHALRSQWKGLLPILSLSAATLLAVFAAFAANQNSGQRWFGLPPWEVIYRLFMSFYGLAFPAYVWIVMIASRATMRRRLIIGGIAVLLAAPAFFIGFINRETVWLLPGVALVLLPRLFMRRPLRNRIATA